VNTLFVITARGGSKGIPGKNIRPLGGKPLLHYAIDLARQFANDSYICVSSDDPAIISSARSTGLDVPFVRPAELSTDEAGSYEVLLHAVGYYSTKIDFETVVLLQPTSPFRLKQHVAGCISKLTGETEMVVSVKKTKANPYQLLFREGNDGYITRLMEGVSSDRRQDAPVIFQLNGAVYVYRRALLLNQSPAGYQKIKHFEMPEVNSIDIDEPLDWDWAEFLLSRGLIKFDYA
jgi:CMP-N,N'-diacetyllegionaminic acid synthase